MHIITCLYSCNLPVCLLLQAFIMHSTNSWGFLAVSYIINRSPASGRSTLTCGQDILSICHVKT